MQPDYDYIITGGGCAGLSLLYRLSEDPFFANKKILIIDSSLKTENDRTWCFWEKNVGVFESIVFHAWDTIEFLGKNDFKTQSAISPYKYKMIKGIDFYTYTKATTQNANNSKWLHAKVEKLYTDTNQLATVLCNGKKITAHFVFNSIVFDTPIPKKNQYYFLQHFVGWEIETESDVFNPLVARFMDFSISQQYGTSFMYVLPVSSTKALVEFTLFTETLLADDNYTAVLKNYIAENLGIQNYTVSHIEKGIIPMTNIRFPLQQGKIINIGIAGNQAKASSGYAFQFIQKRADEIISRLKNNHTSFDGRSCKDRKAALYDATLLRVLQESKLDGASIFTDLFEANTVTDLFSFLDNESSLLTDLKIMNSVPTRIFLPAACKQMLSAI